jgi:transcriptional/translational regulatory protein YebC/TACO1
MSSSRQLRVSVYRFLQKIISTMIRTFKRLHSNWNQIKKHKGELDLKKAQYRAKISQRITQAVKSNGSQADTNVLLRKLLEEARENDVPKKLIEDVIERAKKSSAAGSLSVFEAKYKSVFFLVECMTDNKSRTSQHIRKIVQDSDGQFCGQSNEVSWAFKHSGIMDLYGPLSDKELGLVSSCLKKLQPFYEKLSRLNPAEAGPVIQELDDLVNSDAFQTIIPKSIRVEDIFDKAIDYGADDVYEIDIDFSKTQYADALPLFNIKSAKLSLAKYLPFLRGAQIVVEPHHLDLVSNDLMSETICGHKPLMARSAAMYVPDYAKYGKELWQDYHNQAYSSDDVNNMKTILAKLHGHEEVVQVWHNIRSEDPWRDFVLPEEIQNLDRANEVLV